MKRKRLLILAIFVFSMIILSSCKKKGKKELPVTEGYIELPKEKQDEINDSFKKCIYYIDFPKSTIGEEYNDFTDSFECALVFDDYYFFANTKRNEKKDVYTPNNYMEYYNLSGQYFYSYKMILVYHNNSFSHNIEELFDLRVIDSHQLKNVLELANPGIDYSQLIDIEPVKTSRHNIEGYYNLDINDEIKREINISFYEKFKDNKSLGIDSNYRFTDNYYCIGEKNDYYYFICYNDIEKKALIDPILYECNGIRMYSPGIIFAYKDGEIYLPSYNIILGSEKKGPFEMILKNQYHINNLPREYLFKNIDDVELFKEIVDNILSIRIKNGSWPENIGFPGQEL